MIQHRPEVVKGRTIWENEAMLAIRVVSTQGITLAKLELTEEVKKGMIWFFSRDHHTAHNGVDFMIDFRVYNVID